MNTDLSNLFNDSLALFPIMLLTKTVSSRNRTHKPKEKKYHWIHLTIVALGTAIAFWGAWASSSWPLSTILAILVLLLLAIAGGTLFYDLVTAYNSDGQHQGGEQGHTNTGPSTSAPGD